MTQQMWNELSFLEQMSNIDGDVERLIRSHEKYVSGEAEQDYAEFYLDKIIGLLKKTLLDDKNATKGYRAVEFFDEVEEIRQYLKGEYSADYIRRYWNAYTNAL